MRYCSYEARKVIECVGEYGLEIPEDEYFALEVCVGRFWNTHMQQVIRQIMTGGDPKKKLVRAQLAGWSYFEKPIISMLTPRGQAMRNDAIDIPTDVEWISKLYNMVTSGFLLADFNMNELKVLTIDLPTLVVDVEECSRAMAACRTANVRNVNYLAGVARREYQTRQGRIREIQETDTPAGWEPPPDFEKVDIVERRELAALWQDQLREIEIQKALNEM